MSERAEVSLNQIREQAGRLEQAALRQVAAVKSMLKRAGDDGARKQISETCDAIRSIGDQIQSLKAKIAKERKPVLDVLAQAEDAMLRTQSEAERLTRQIQEKEREIDRLSSKEIPRSTALGDIIVPDGDARARASALRVEIAGLYRALGTAKETAADAVRTRDELQAQVMQFPVEADPRMAELYRNLEAETAAIASIQDQAVGRAPQGAPAVFSNDQKKRMSEFISNRMKTTIPDFLEGQAFLHAIGRVESSLSELLPAEILNLMTQRNGLSGDSRALEARLVEALQKSLDLPLFDAKERAAFFQHIAALVAGAMKQDITLDAVLDEAESADARTVTKEVGKKERSTPAEPRKENKAQKRK